jgi:hypothetical protein
MPPPNFDPFSGQVTGYQDPMAQFNPWLPVQPGYVGPASLPDTSYGKVVPDDMSAVSDRLDLIQNLMDLRRDPFFNYAVAAETGAPTFNYDMLNGVPSGLPGLDAALGFGGGGGGGGYSSSSSGYDSSGGYSSGGGGFTPELFTTDRMKTLRKSDDPNMNMIANLTRKGVDPGTIKMQLLDDMNTPGSSITPEKLEIYNGAVDDAFSEYTTFNRTQLQNKQGMMQAQQGSPGINTLQEYFSGWGTPTPKPYGPGNWPGDMQADIEANMPTAQADFIRRNRKAMAQLRPEARYRPEGFGRDTPEENAQEATIHNAAISAGPSAVGGTSPWGGGFVGPQGAGAVPYTPDYTPQQNAFLGDVGGAASGAWGGMFGGGSSSNPFAGNSGWSAMRPETGEYEMNAPAQQMDWLQNQNQQYRQDMNQAQQQYQNIIQGDIAESGRTPQRDAMNAQLNYLRSMGLNI